LKTVPKKEKENFFFFREGDKDKVCKQAVSTKAVPMKEKKTTAVPSASQATC
jgi:hypothetical protein